MTALLLFPGAGSSSTQPGLLAIEAAVAPLPCRRADFPYRLAGRKAPDRPPLLLDTVRTHAAEMADAAGGANRLVLGGRSMGGRFCSMAVGDEADPLPAAGLVLISYPLHPPGRPDSLRVAHFPRLTVPCLFISGTRDAFGSPDELTNWTSTIPGPVTHHWVEGRGHDLKGADTAVGGVVAEWIGEIDRLSPRRRTRRRAGRQG